VIIVTDGTADTMHVHLQIYLSKAHECTRVGWRSIHEQAANRRRARSEGKGSEASGRQDCKKGKGEGKQWIASSASASYTRKWGETRKRGIGQEAARGQEMAAESGDGRGDRAGTGGG